jgi:competence protein ComEC
MAILLVPLTLLGTLWGLAFVDVPWWAAGLPGAAGLGALFLGRRGGPVVAGLSLLALALAVLRAGTGGVAPGDTPLEREVAGGAVVALRGTVAEPPLPRERAQRVRLRVDAAGEADGTWHATSGYAEVTAGAVPAVAYRDVVEVQGDVRPAATSASPAYARALRRQGIDVVTAFPRVVPLGIAPERDPLRGTLFAVRERLAAPLEALLPEPQAALVEALLLGRRGTIPPTLNEQLVRSGTIHVVAISGYKVSLVVGAVTAATTGLLGRRRRDRLPAVFLASAGLWGFVALVGPTGSVLRAAATSQLALAGRLAGRSGPAGGLLLWGSALLALWRPDLVQDAGWQLSFLGTAGLIWLGPALAARLGWLPAFVREGLCATLAAQVFVLPVLGATFGRISLVAPLASILALPLVPPVMLGGAGIEGAALLCPPAVPLLAALTWVPATALLGVITWTANLPGAEAPLPAWGPAVTVGYLVALLLLVGALQWRAEHAPDAASLGPPTTHRAPAGPARLEAPALGLLAALALVGWAGAFPAGLPWSVRGLEVSLPDVPSGT